MSKRVLLSIASCALMLLATTAGKSAAETPPSGHKIDPSGFRETFVEDFDRLDVSAWGPGTRWIAHTPYNGDFGDARFTDPGKNFPFTVKDGMLRIEMRKDDKGRWRSGLLSSVDRLGKGFAQKYGYFEIRTKLPPGKGTWPAFWLLGLDRMTQDKHTAEVDIFEYLGHMPYRFASHVHKRDRVDGSTSKSANKITRIPDHQFTEDFNTFGVLIDHDWMRFYLNRREFWKTPTPEVHRQPMFILLNLGLGSGYPIDETPSPSYMLVDYVKVWALPETTPKK